jgi:hypothetical protein
MRINGASRSNATLQEPGLIGEKKLGSNEDRRVTSPSTFKRLARRRGSFDLLARGFSAPRFDRAGLQTAWKYAYLGRAGHRLTRYVE